MSDEMPKGAAARERSLDLLLEMDEPEELMRELRRAAEAKAAKLRGDERTSWRHIAEWAATCERELMSVNEPVRKDE